jgi:hypothetical protein
MKRLTQDEFIEKCNDVHNRRYDYDKTIYVNYRTRIVVTCPVHGDFEMLPDNHMNQKQGCVKCVRDNHKISKISEDRLDNIKKIHSNKYTYNLQVVDGRIEITCPTHGKFEQSIYNHERGHGCDKCNIDNRKVIKYRTCKCCGAVKTKDQYNSKYRTCNDCITSNPIIDRKVCNKCNIEKDIDNFHKRSDTSIEYRHECIECFNYIKKDSAKIYRQKNKKELRRKDISYRKKRMETDSLYRSKMDARSVIRKSISKMGYSKNSKTEDILGCSFIEFKGHIESLFVDNMSWGNRTEWHIDHIVPISIAEDEYEVHLLNNYKNLRPLFISDNLSKSDDITIKSDIYYQIMEHRKNIVYEV